MVALRSFVAFIIFLVFTLLCIKDPKALRKYYLKLEDSKFSIRHLLDFDPKPFENIVIVAVDEKSVNKLGRWPWDRKIIGKLIKMLSSAKIVALDIVFSERTSPEDDAYLADAIYTSGNVILSFFFRENATETVDEKAFTYLEDCSLPRYRALDKKIGLKEFPYAEVNIPEIAESSLSCAFFNTEPDADGIYRRYPIAYIFKGLVFPSMAVQAVRYYFNRDIKLILSKKGIEEFHFSNTTIKGRNFIKLNFYRKIPYISAVDVLNGVYPRENLKGKIVLVGVTEMGIYDMRPTPVDPIAPGVELHFTALSNIIKGDCLKESKIFDVILIFLVLLLSFLISFRPHVYKRYLLYGILLLALFSFVNALFIAKNIWLNLFYPLSSSVSFITATEFISFFKTEKKVREIKRAFSSYVSPEVVEEIARDPEKLKLGGEEREISVLFSDIRDFTSLSEKLTPSEVVNILNRYFDPVTKAIFDNKGTLDKFIGDAVMVIFNAPANVEDHSKKACLTALEILRILRRLNREFEKEGFPTLDVGVGINTGVAVVGNMGSSIRFEYTAIGDTVNLASRLESLNKAYGTRIIISEFTARYLDNRFLLRQLDVVRVKGKDLPVKIYELMEGSEVNRKVKSLFEKALRLYFRRKFQEAMVYFKKIYESYNDNPSLTFAERCLFFLKNPPPDDWDGVYTFETK